MSDYYPEQRKAGSHVPEQILRQDDAVELSWVRDQNHGSGVYELVIELELRVFRLQRLCHDLPP